MSKHHHQHASLPIHRTSRPVPLDSATRRTPQTSSAYATSSRHHQGPVETSSASSSSVVQPPPPTPPTARKAPSTRHHHHHLHQHEERPHSSTSAASTEPNNNTREQRQHASTTPTAPPPTPSSTMASSSLYDPHAPLYVGTEAPFGAKVTYKVTQQCYDWRTVSRRDSTSAVDAVLCQRMLSSLLKDLHSGADSTESYRLPRLLNDSEQATMADGSAYLEEAMRETSWQYTGLVSRASGLPHGWGTLTLAEQLWVADEEEDEKGADQEGSIKEEEQQHHHPVATMVIASGKWNHGIPNGRGMQRVTIPRSFYHREEKRQRRQQRKEVDENQGEEQDASASPSNNNNSSSNNIWQYEGMFRDGRKVGPFSTTHFSSGAQFRDTFEVIDAKRRSIRTTTRGRSSSSSAEETIEPSSRLKREIITPPTASAHGVLVATAAAREDGDSSAAPSRSTSRGQGGRQSRAATSSPTQSNRGQSPTSRPRTVTPRSRPSSAASSRPTATPQPPPHAHFERPRRLAMSRLAQQKKKESKRPHSAHYRQAQKEFLQKRILPSRMATQDPLAQLAADIFLNVTNRSTVDKEVAYDTTHAQDRDIVAGATRPNSARGSVTPRPPPVKHSQRMTRPQSAAAAARRSPPSTPRSLLHPHSDHDPHNGESSSRDGIHWRKGNSLVEESHDRSLCEEVLERTARRNEARCWSSCQAAADLLLAFKAAVPNDSQNHHGSSSSPPLVSPSSRVAAELRVSSTSRRTNAFVGGGASPRNHQNLTSWKPKAEEEDDAEQQHNQSTLSRPVSSAAAYSHRSTSALSSTRQGQQRTATPMEQVQRMREREMLLSRQHVAWAHVAPFRLGQHVSVSMRRLGEVSGTVRYIGPKLPISNKQHKLLRAVGVARLPMGNGEEEAEEPGLDQNQTATSATTTRDPRLLRALHAEWVVGVECFSPLNGAAAHHLVASGGHGKDEVVPSSSSSSLLDGAVGRHRYFYCESGRGLVVPLQYIVSSTMRPPFQ